MRVVHAPIERSRGRVLAPCPVSNPIWVQNFTIPQ
nr:MAG TPA_asm: hypothetical protein [Caudoviricetes sp.]